MKTVFFESLRYKLITKNDFYYGSCPDIRIQDTDMLDTSKDYYITGRVNPIFCAGGLR